MVEIKVGSKTISQTSPTYFVADVAANHDGNLDRAIQLIHLAKEAGADAAKFQNFKAAKIVSDHGFKSLGAQASHQAEWKKSVFEVYQDASISQDWTPILKAECEKAGIDYFSSPYDFESVDHIDPYVDLYKIGSGDVTWTEMLEYIAKKGKPVMIASGASSIGEVQIAMETILKITDQVVLMQCNTNYTASETNYDFLNIRVLETFKTMYPDVVIGLSDHTKDPAPVLGAVAMGARVIERHFTDSNDREGPDHKFALNPEDWAKMVQQTRILERSLGRPIKKIEDNEKETVVLQRRCIRVKDSVKAGTQLTKDHLEYLRPAPVDGLAPYDLEKVLGKTLGRDLPAGEAVRLSDLSL